ncbi:MAG: S-layer protein domain-containing protein [Candidatus Methanoperedens sp.]|nr:S-layer protein domain-containing protein [Candidatus Methanoperedens sp.]
MILIGSAGGDTLLNGTAVYLATGDSYGLYQGYVLDVKSVSNDGSVWLQLTENDRIVKSDIVVDKGYFIYNKTNRTILSVKVDNIYSGSPEQNLVSLYIHQFTDPDMPMPDITEIIPDTTRNPGNNNSSVRIYTPEEPLIWVFGIVFILILFYVLRKLW